MEQTHARLLMIIFTLLALTSSLRAELDPLDDPTPESRLGDFVHFVLTERPDEAAASLAALLDYRWPDGRFAELVDEGQQGGPRVDRAVELAGQYPQLARAVTDFSARLERGRDDLRSVRKNLRNVIGTLSKEARQSEREESLVRKRPDVARRFPHYLPPHRVALEMLKPAHPDPFVDAYIRWQLTSFEPDFATIEDEAYLEMLREMPRVPTNPRAGDRIREEFSQLSRAGELSPRAVARVEAAMQQLRERENNVRQFATPARQLRQFLLKQAETDDARLRVLMIGLERVASEVRAGWNADRAKNDLTARLEQMDATRTMTRSDRATFHRLLTRQERVRRPYVANARIEQGILQLSVTEAAIFDFDITRWVRLLNMVRSAAGTGG